MLTLQGESRLPTIEAWSTLDVVFEIHWFQDFFIEDNPSILLFVLYILRNSKGGLFGQNYWFFRIRSNVAEIWRRIERKKCHYSWQTISQINLFLSIWEKCECVIERLLKRIQDFTKKNINIPKKWCSEELWKDRWLFQKLDSTALMLSSL